MRTLPLALILAVVSACTSAAPSSSPTPPRSLPPAVVGAVIDVGPMTVARASHTATLLPDGTVLVAGGCTTPGCGGFAAGGQTEIYNPADGTFDAGPAMLQARAGHTATKLSDGRILFLGGYPEEARAPLATSEIYDPPARRFTAAGAMRTARGSHTATLMRDGRVLVVGGVSGISALSTVEIYDPATGSFSAGPSLPEPRATHGAVLLGDGRVLVAGGQSRAGHGNGIVGTSLIYDPVANTWQAAASLRQAKYKLAVAPLPDGGALVIGGQTADDAASRLRETEIFDASSGTFKPGPEMAEPRYKISDAVAVLRDGRLVIAGNYGVEVYESGTFTRLEVPAGGPERQFPATVALATGQVLITGGYSERTEPTASAVLATA